MRNILVTGGAGFIGSTFIKYMFRKYGDEIHIANIDKLTYCANLDNLKEIEKRTNYSFFEHDIGNKDVIEGMLHVYKPDVIVNFAAQTHVDRSIRYPREFLETDIMGLFNMVFSCINAKKIPKFLHVSTDEVYGSIKHGEYATEENLLNPTSPYAGSKAAGDLLLLTYVKTYDFPAIIVRPCNNYGPSQYPEKLVPAVITRVLDGKKAYLHGTGKEIREWIYVEDCCRAIDKLTEIGKVGEIYNIGSGVWLNNATMIKSMIKTIHGTGIDFRDCIEEVPNRPGNDSRYAIDSTKTKGLIGEYLTTRLEDGLRITVDWYKKHKDFWGKIDISANLYDDKYLR